MLSENDCWIPGTIDLREYNGNFVEYENALYENFKRDFIDSQPFFRGLPVEIRREPMEYNKEEAFFHITCQDYAKDHNRSPDFRRCERINWVRAFIENYECEDYQCDCDGIKIWDEPGRSKRMQTCILSEFERYIVILENRNNYYLLITAYYIEYDRVMDKKLRNYEKYSK